MSFFIIMERISKFNTCGFKQIYKKLPLVRIKSIRLQDQFSLLTMYKMITINIIIVACSGLNHIQIHDD